MGLGECRVARDPRTMLVAYGLGSCVGLVLCAPGEAVALLHVVLPTSRGARTGEPGKYADTAVPYALAVLTGQGVPMRRLVAVLCGGASIFASEIGRANVAALRQELQKARVPIAAEDVGGRRGRTVFAELSGRVVVQEAGAEPRELWARAGGAGGQP